MERELKSRHYRTARSKEGLPTDRCMAQPLTSPPEPQPAGCAGEWRRWKPWLLRNFLVLGFAAVITLGLSWPLPGAEVRAT